MFRTWGSDQPETVQAMAELADLHREMKAESNAEAVERDIIQVWRGAEREGLSFHCGVTGGAAGFGSGREPQRSHLRYSACSGKCGGKRRGGWAEAGRGGNGGRGQEGQLEWNAGKEPNWLSGTASDNAQHHSQLATLQPFLPLSFAFRLARAC